MSKITSDYIAKRAPAVHTADSFARAFSDHMLKVAYDKLSDGSSQDEVVIDDISASISQHETVSGLVCIKVCINTPFGRLCHHVGL